MHVAELQRMGANIRIDGRTAHGHRATRRSPGAQVMATDLRASACLVLGRPGRRAARPSSTASTTSTAATTASTRSCAAWAPTSSASTAADRRRHRRAARRRPGVNAGRRCAARCSPGTAATAATCPGGAPATRTAIWVSEVMLQQTTVKAATPYYEALPRALPRRRRLAAAPEEDVLAALVGPRLLPPRAQPAARRAPRRGPARRRASRARSRPRSPCPASASTPRAPCSRSPTACRCRWWTATCGACWRALFALRGPEWRADAPVLQPAPRSCSTARRPGDWNQALMELGATVCTPRAPACPRLPVARALPGAGARPPGGAAAKPRAAARRWTVTVAAALVERRRARPARAAAARDGSWAACGRCRRRSLEARGLPDLARELRERHGLELGAGPLVRARARHAITFRRIRVEAYDAHAASRSRRATPSASAGSTPDGAGARCPCRR